ncbi:MAG: sel1 repeat family protein [Gammaproteobacteria bacterium]|nr:sel1 repeat family protein [Gammaproteobacteria bacterium]
MNANELIAILQTALSGDDSSLLTLRNLCHEKKLSAADLETMHHFLSVHGQQKHRAIYLRGLLYELGCGVGQDYAMAFLLMREAAAKGNAQAMFEVGRLHMQGLGVTQNYPNALQWLSLAAGSPYYVVDAMFALGEVYEQGLGIQIDLQQALIWYAQAADKGHRAAKEKLSNLQAQ